MGCIVFAETGSLGEARLTTTDPEVSLEVIITAVPVRRQPARSIANYPITYLDRYTGQRHGTVDWWVNVGAKSVCHRGTINDFLLGTGETCAAYIRVESTYIRIRNTTTSRGQNAKDLS